MARGVTTQWEDIHVAKGNWKPREHVATSEEIFQAQQETIEKYDHWKGVDKQKLEQMVEDDLDLEDDEYMKEYQAKRLAEMKEQSQQHKFNFGMIDITKADYEWHVQNMPKDTLGVILMYQDYIAESNILKECLGQIANMHTTRKFMQIQATKCVENFQDQDVPCLLFYKNGELYDQIAGMKCRTIFGGKHMNVHTVEYVLSKKKQFLEIEFKEDPRDSLKTFNAFIHKKKAFLGKDEDQSGSEGEDDREYINNQMFRYKHKN